MPRSAFTFPLLVLFGATALSPDVRPLTWGGAFASPRDTTIEVASDMGWTQGERCCGCACASNHARTACGPQHASILACRARFLRCVVAAPRPCEAPVGVRVWHAVAFDGFPRTCEEACEEAGVACRARRPVPETVGAPRRPAERSSDIARMVLSNERKRHRAVVWRLP